MPPVCLQLDDEASAEILKRLRSLNHAIHSLQREQYRSQWYLALQKIVNTPAAHAEISGSCSRILFEKRVQTQAETSRQMHFMLSAAMDAKTSAQWLEGFLYGSGLLLIHHPDLWRVLNDWVRQIPKATFEEILPLLRRAFADFSTPERGKLLQLAQYGFLPSERTLPVLEVVEKAEVEATVRVLLGYV